MRVLKTEDCFYISGGNASDTNTGNFGDVGNMGETRSDGISTDQQLALVDQFGNITRGPTTFSNPVSQSGSVVGAFAGSVRAGNLSHRDNGPAAPAPNYDAFGNQQGGGTFGGDGGPKN